jgi:MFS family permease
MPASRKSEKGFYGWINLAVTAIMGIMMGFYLVGFSLFLPILVEDFGWSRGVASLASTINMIAMGLCGPIAGFYIVKHGARRSLVLGNILGCLGFVLMSFQSHLWQLFLGYGLMIGVGMGFGGMLGLTTVVNNWFAKKRSLALSVFLGSSGAGGIVMGPALVILIEQIGWRYTYLAMAILILLFNVLLPSIMIRNKPQDLGQVPDGPSESMPAAENKSAPRQANYRTPVDFTEKEAIQTLTLWLLIAYFCLNMLAMGALMTHIFGHMLDMGISRILASTAMSVMMGVMTFTQFSVGFLGIRYNLHSIAIVAEILKLIGMTVLVFTNSLPFVFAYMVIFGLGFGAVIVATMNLFPNYFGTSDYPKIMGFVRLFWTFVGGAGAPLAGQIRESTGSFLPAYRMSLAVLAIGLICLVFAKPPVHPSLRKPKPADALAAADGVD